MTQSHQLSLQERLLVKESMVASAPNTRNLKIEWNLTLESLPRLPSLGLGNIPFPLSEYGLSENLTSPPDPFLSVIAQQELEDFWKYLRLRHPPRSF